VLISRDRIAPSFAEATAFASFGAEIESVERSHCEGSLRFCEKTIIIGEDIKEKRILNEIFGMVAMAKFFSTFR
jgi:hypothetical protein